MFFKVGARRPGGSAARFHFGTLRREIPFIPQATAGTWLGSLVGADVPGGPPPARDVRQSDLVRGAGRARGTRAPTNVGVLMHQGQRVCVGGGMPRAEGGAARPHDAARFHFGTGPHRRARVPAPRHEAPRRRKMRFHRVIILKAVTPRGVIRSAIAALPGSVSAARARREADTFPVLAHRVPVKIDIPVRSAGGGRHGPPLEKSG